MLNRIKPPQYRKAFNTDSRQPFIHVADVGKRRIAVHIRLRPLSMKEIVAKRFPIYAVTQTSDARKNYNVLEINKAMPAVSKTFRPLLKQKNFSSITYDKGFRVSGKCFPESTSTIRVYEESLQEVVLNSTEGLHTAVLGLGLEKSGLSHTFLGSLQRPGLILQTISDLFLMIDCYSNPNDSPLHQWSVMKPMWNCRYWTRPEKSEGRTGSSTQRLQFVVRICMLECSPNGLHNLILHQQSTGLTKERIASPFHTAYQLPDDQWIVVSNIKQATRYLIRALAYRNKRKENKEKGLVSDAFVCILRIERLVVKFPTPSSQPVREYPYNLHLFSKNIQIKERTEGSIAFVLQTYSTDSIFQKNYRKEHGEKNSNDLLQLLQILSRAEKGSASAQNINSLVDESPLLQILNPYLYHYGYLTLILCVNPSSHLAIQNFTFLDLAHNLSTLVQEIKLWYTGFSFQSFYCTHVIKHLRELSEILWWFSIHQRHQNLQCSEKYEKHIYYILGIVKNAGQLPWSQSKHSRVTRITVVLTQYLQYYNIPNIPFDSIQLKVNLDSKDINSTFIDHKINQLISDFYAKKKRLNKASSLKNNAEIMSSSTLDLHRLYQERMDTGLLCDKFTNQKTPDAIPDKNYQHNIQDEKHQYPSNISISHSQNITPFQSMDKANAPDPAEKVVKNAVYTNKLPPGLAAPSERLFWEYLNDLSTESFSVCSDDSQFYERSPRNRKSLLRISRNPRGSKKRRSLLRKMPQKNFRHKHHNSRHRDAMYRRPTVNIRRGVFPKRRPHHVRTSGKQVSKKLRRMSRKHHVNQTHKSGIPYEERAVAKTSNVYENLQNNNIIKPTLEHHYGISTSAPYFPFKYPQPGPDIKPVVVHLHRHDLKDAECTRQDMLCACTPAADVYAGAATASAICDLDGTSKDYPVKEHVRDSTIVSYKWGSERPVSQPGILSFKTGKSKTKATSGRPRFPPSRLRNTQKEFTSQESDESFEYRGHRKYHGQSSSTYESEAEETTSSYVSSSEYSLESSDFTNSFDAHESLGSYGLNKFNHNKASKINDHITNLNGHRYIVNHSHGVSRHSVQRDICKNVNKKELLRYERRRLTKKLMQQLYHQPECDGILLGRTLQDLLPLLRNSQKKFLLNTIPWCRPASSQNQRDLQEAEPKENFFVSHMSSTSTASLSSLETDRLLVDIHSLERVDDKYRRAVLRGEVGTAKNRASEKKKLHLKEAIADLPTSRILNHPHNQLLKQDTQSAPFVEQGSSIDLINMDDHDIPPVYNIKEKFRDPQSIKRTDSCEPVGEDLYCLARRQSIKEIHDSATLIKVRDLPSGSLSIFKDDLALLAKQLERNQEVCERLTSTITEMHHEKKDEITPLPVLYIHTVGDEVTSTPPPVEQRSKKYLTLNSANTAITPEVPERKVIDDTRTAQIPLEDMVPVPVSSNASAMDDGILKEEKLSPENQGPHEHTAPLEKCDVVEQSYSQHFESQGQSDKATSIPYYSGYIVEPKEEEKEKKECKPYQFYPPPYRRKFDSDLGAPLPINHLVWGGAHAKKYYNVECEGQAFNQTQESSIVNDAFDKSPNLDWMKNQKIPPEFFFNQKKSSENITWQECLRPYLNKPWRSRVTKTFQLMNQRIAKNLGKSQPNSNADGNLESSKLLDKAQSSVLSGSV